MEDVGRGKGEENNRETVGEEASKASEREVEGRGGRHPGQVAEKSLSAGGGAHVDQCDKGPLHLHMETPPRLLS